MNATFTVAATGTGTLRYQWQRDSFDIPGATDATFVLPRVARTAEDAYDVVVTDATGSARSNAGRLWVSPAQYAGNFATDPDFDLRLELSSTAEVTAVRATADGGYYAIGNFTSINGLFRCGIAHFKADDTVDPVFAPPSIDALPLRAMAIQPDGKVIVGGAFGTVGGQIRGSVARLNPDGSLDASFATQVFVAGNSVSGIAVMPDGRIAVATASGVMVLKPDGSYDSAPLANGAFVNAIAAQPDGKLIAVGHFTVYAAGSSWRNVVRFNLDGTADSRFASLGFGETPICVTVGSDGAIYVGEVQRRALRSCGSLFLPTAHSTRRSRPTWPSTGVSTRWHRRRAGNSTSLEHRGVAERWNG